MAAAAVSPDDRSLRGEPREDFSLPALDVRALARRAALPAALAAVVVGVVLVAGGPLEAFADALHRAVDADPRWVALAAAFELLSFGGYVALLWLVGGRVSSRLGPRESLQITLGGAAATRLLPTAGVGGAALTLWALRRSGLSTARASRTLSSFLVLLYAVFLGSIAVTGTLLAVKGEASLALTALPAAGAVIAMTLALLFGVLGPAAAGAGRLRTGVGVFGSGVRDALAHVRYPDPRLLGAIAWWAFDMAVLWAMLQAFGAPPAFAIVVLAYFVGQVGNTVPIPGAVSGGIVGVLLAFGVEADLAIASVLAYRAVAIWLPAPIGLVALSGLRRTIARWGAEDKAPAANAETAATSAADDFAPASHAVAADAHDFALASHNSAADSHDFALASHDFATASRDSAAPSRSAAASRDSAAHQHDVAAHQHDVAAHQHDVAAPSSRDLAAASSRDLAAASSRDVVAASSRDVVAASSRDVVAPSSRDVVAPSSRDSSSADGVVAVVKVVPPAARARPRGARLRERWPCGEPAVA